MNKHETKPQAASPVDHQPDFQKVLLSVCLALMAVIASVSGLNVAQPMLALEFGVPQNTVLWIINIYALTLAAFLLPLGALGDRLGRKKMLVGGLIVFGAASFLSAVSASAKIMLIARLLTGIGAASIMPVTLAVITSTFPEQQRSKAVGIWTGVAGAGGILGMYLSALLVDIASWRWLFLLPIVLATVSIAMTLRFVPNSTVRAQYRFDYVGSLLSVLASVGVVYSLHEAPALGWDEPIVLASLIIAIIAMAGFIVWELGQPEPLLDIRFFRERSLSSGTISLLTIFGVQAGIFVVLFPFFQGVLGWSGLRSTLAMMPMALSMMASSWLAPKVAYKIGRKYTMAIGVAMGAIGATLMGQLVSVDGGYLPILPGLLVMGLGMGFSMTPSTEAITSSLPAERQGVASAINDVTRELGTALGVALLGPLVTARYSLAVGVRLKGFPKEVVAAAKEGLPHAQVIAPTTGARADLFVRAAQESFVTAWQQAIWVGVVIMVLLLIYILLFGPKRLNAHT